MLFTTCRIGFIIGPGLRPAHVAGPQSVLGLHPGNKTVHISSQAGFVTDQGGYAIEAEHSFDDAPDLDLLVIPDLDPGFGQREEVRRFLQRQVKGAKLVIAIGSGLISLVNAGLMAGARVTSDETTLSALTDADVESVRGQGPVQWGKFITAGPSTGALEAAYLALAALRGRWLARLAELVLEYEPRRRYDAPADQPSPPLPSQPLKVAVISPPWLYSPDIIGAVDVFSALPNAEFHYVWEQPGASRSIFGHRSRSTLSFDLCPEVDVVVVGAMLPWVSANENALRFIQRQHSSAQVFIGTCAGALFLASAGLLEQKSATTNFTMIPLLAKLGAKPEEDPVVREDKVITSAPAVGSYEAALMAIEQLYGAEVAAALETRVLEYRPKPLFGVGSPEKASLSLRFAASLMKPLNPFYLWFARRGRQFSQRQQAQSR
ncbi:DJ-1/PfpI family protein [Ferrimonas sp. YFM]|uniref:DJ-1/PfpI family protein n=1 Tax=Ferrimonas sp. YFM TaxID=3028878 RepID=UPI0025736E69|nr:DJ-1/PfpI family protein [Ferrimonas sp. YFM]BDY04715.1 hypothetical protein F0521_17560 [Ferrimonas sp. YFM]